MTDLHLALFALGAVIIAAVILFNWWQEQRIRRETVRRFDGPIEDALMVETYQSSSRTLIHEDNVEQEISLHVVTEHAIPLERTSIEKIEPTFSFDSPPVNSPSETASPSSVEEYPQADFSDQKEEPENLSGTSTEQGSSFSSVLSEMRQEDAPTPHLAEPVETAAPVAAASAKPALASASDLPPNIDEQIDLLAVITLPQFINGEKIREAMLPLPQLDKPSQWMGLNMDGLWRHFTKDQEQTRFSQIVGWLQLADRSGAASPATLHEFQRKAEEAAERLSASLDWRGPASPQRYAQELDQFCIEVDVMVSLHLVAGAGGPFAGTKLRGLAEAGGMILQDDGTFHYVNDANELQFSLLHQGNGSFTAEMLRTELINAVTLQLDVTRVANCVEAFSKMVILAGRMEQGLNAKLVDDNQRVLGDVEIDKIRQHLKKINTTMTAHHIVPGSPTALRLFS